MPEWGPISDVGCYDGLEGINELLRQLAPSAHAEKPLEGQTSDDVEHGGQVTVATTGGINPVGHIGEPCKPTTGQRDPDLLSHDGFIPSPVMQQQADKPGSSNQPEPANHSSFAGLGPYPVNHPANSPPYSQCQDPERLLSDSLSAGSAGSGNRHDSSPTLNATDISPQLRPSAPEFLEVASNSTPHNLDDIDNDGRNAVVVQERNWFLAGAHWLFSSFLSFAYMLSHVFAQAADTPTGPNDLDWYFCLSWSVSSA
ncbi:hypothetical protein D9619_003878 [Psilocybe cf. subviscida]|uniref:Uncharacterized protein n=1 Tax=Psilocybe cf. subviscida TaxID=2480587 RepID=A0A8H5BQK7_9AGAR|nr:hypothetical protein D9619_003878 [Psilocybe cf. subviscida]